MEKIQNVDEEIDIRVIIHSLWKGKWVIILISIIIALIVFLISFWFIPKKYSAISYVSIIEPILTFSDESNISITLTSPDISSLVEISTTEALLNKVASSPAISSFRGIEIGPISDMANSSNIGNYLIKLEVISENPTFSMDIANIWADEFVSQVNMQFSVNAVANKLDSQVTDALDNYKNAQANLEDELSLNQIDKYRAQLNNAKSSLTCELNRNQAANLILEDLNILNHVLLSQSSGTNLSLGDALALTILQQRTSANQICLSITQFPQIQVSTDSLTIINIDEAQSAIFQMKNALETQLPFFQIKQINLSKEIPILQSALSNSEYMLYQMTYERDLSKELYNTLRQQQNRIKTILNSSSNIANVSYKATLPQNKVSPNTLMNTAIAGLMGILIGAIWVFVADMWKTDENIENNILIKSQNKE
jgi:polysaccharide biosynthesis transport protein